MQNERTPPVVRQPQFWLGIIISLLCLAGLFFFIKPADILTAVRDAQYNYLALAILSILFFMIFRAVRWQFMLNSSDSSDQNIPYGQVFHIQNIGYMLNNLLPLRLGDLSRAVLIGNVPPMTISKGVSTMVVERIFDLLFMVILFPFTLAAAAELPPDIQTAVQFTGLIAIIATIILIIAANQRRKAASIAEIFLKRFPFMDTSVWLERLDNLLAGLNSLTRFKDGLILVGLSIAVWLPIISGYYYAMLAVNLSPTLLQATFAVCIAAFSVSVPSSPGQVGVFEAGVTFALVSILGFPGDKSASFAFLYHATNILFLGILGIIGINRTSSTLGNVISSARALSGS